MGSNCLEDGCVSRKASLQRTLAVVKTTVLCRTITHTSLFACRVVMKSRRIPGTGTLAKGSQFTCKRPRWESPVENTDLVTEMSVSESPSDLRDAPKVKKAFVKPEITFPVDVLEATSFFQAVDSGATN